MTIQDLKNYFEKTDKPKFFLTDVFSWRGIYDEVAFTPSKEGTKEKSLELIKESLENSYRGWKGGIFTYDLDTEVHFEYDPSDCMNRTVGEYLNIHIDL